MHAVKHMLANLEIAPLLLDPATAIQTCICSYPLSQRVSKNWKVLMTDGSTIIAVTCFVLNLLNGSTALCIIFAFTAASLGISAFYLRRFDELRGLEETVSRLETSLQDSQTQFGLLADQLRGENQRLAETNQELLNTNEAFRTTNGQLTHQVAELSLQVTHLQGSAERIREQITHFQQQNTHLQGNVSGLDQSISILDEQILTSRGLSQQISNYFATQQQDLSQQLTHLSQYLVELRSQSGVNERIIQLCTLQQQTLQTMSQLNEVRVQYAQEHANFQAVHQALVEIKNQFDTSMREAVSNYASNNQAFRDSLNGLATEWQRIQSILARYFPRGTDSSLPRIHHTLQLGSVII